MINGEDKPNTNLRKLTVLSGEYKHVHILFIFIHAHRTAYMCYSWELSAFVKGSANSAEIEANLTSMRRKKVKKPSGTHIFFGCAVVWEMLTVTGYVSHT